MKETDETWIQRRKKSNENLLEDDYKEVKNKRETIKKSLGHIIQVYNIAF